MDDAAVSAMEMLRGGSSGFIRPAACMRGFGSPRDGGDDVDRAAVRGGRSLN
jgi:hypothetical protein